MTVGLPARRHVLPPSVHPQGIAHALPHAQLDLDGLDGGAGALLAGASLR